jgi:di/tricarboxylate transporter
MVVINQHQFSVETRRKGFVCWRVCMLAIFAGSIGWVPDTIAIMMVAMMAVFTRCIKLDSAYANIDWRLLILIGGMMGFGEAMRGSGASSMIAEAISPDGCHWACLPSLPRSACSPRYSLNPCRMPRRRLVMLPVALQAAAALGASQRAFAIGVMLSASCSVLTPFEPSCMLVYGPGKYRFSDFIKVGGGLTIRHAPRRAGDGADVLAAEIT